MDVGRDDDRSVLVRVGVGESRAGPAKCCGEEEEGGTSWTGGVLDTGVEADVGDFGAPKADMNESTMQGMSCRQTSMGSSVHLAYL